MQNPASNEETAYGIGMSMGYTYALSYYFEKAELRYATLTKYAQPINIIAHCADKFYAGYLRGLELGNLHRWVWQQNDSWQPFPEVQLNSIKASTSSYMDQHLKNLIVCIPALVVKAPARGAKKSSNTKNTNVAGRQDKIDRAYIRRIAAKIVNATKCSYEELIDMCIYKLYETSPSVLFKVLSIMVTHGSVRNFKEKVVKWRDECKERKKCEKITLLTAGYEFAEVFIAKDKLSQFMQPMVDKRYEEILEAHKKKYCTEATTSNHSNDVRLAVPKNDAIPTLSNR
jgi:hypothetical protein